MFFVELWEGKDIFFCWIDISTITVCNLDLYVYDIYIYVYLDYELETNR